MLDWKIGSENNVARYEIEVAKGETNLQQQIFEKLGEVTSQGNTNSERNYQFTDIQPDKTGVRYYRLKIVDINNRFEYSVIKPVIFNSEVQFNIYPNPSNGNFNFVYLVNIGDVLKANLYDATGKQMHQFTATGNGLMQKTTIDMQSPRYAPGVYHLKLEAGDKIHILTLIKK